MIAQYTRLLCFILLPLIQLEPTARTHVHAKTRARAYVCRLIGATNTRFFPNKKRILKTLWAIF